MESDSIFEALEMPNRRKALIGLSTLALAGPTLAQELRPKLTVAVIELMPWAMTSPTGETTGLFVEIATLLSAVSGVFLEVVPLPYPRALTMLEMGKVDLMFAIDGQRLDGSACRVAPFASEDVVLLGRPGFSVRSLDDLRGKTVGTLRFADYDSAFTAAKGIIKYPTKSYAQGLHMMRYGRLDALILVRTALEYTIDALGYSKGTFGETLVLRKSFLSLYASKKCASDQTIGHLRHACDTLLRKQTLQALTQQMNTTKLA